MWSFNIPGPLIDLSGSYGCAALKLQLLVFDNESKRLESDYLFKFGTNNAFKMRVEISTW